MSGYAVVDLETTGIHPGRHERIVEVAVVHVSPRGAITGTWETLVNPGRDLGPQRVHGIRAAEILPAPTFEQIAGELAALLRGRVVVAHNLRFDAGFLAAEYRRCGYQVPLAVEHGLCTMGLAHRYLPGSGRSLADCCAAFGITIANAHRASADALAAAELLVGYLGLDPHAVHWSEVIMRAASLAWPLMAPSSTAWLPREQARRPQRHFLTRLVERLPDPRLPDQHGAYLAMLDQALLDRHLSLAEADGLVAVATELGMGRSAASEWEQEVAEARLVPHPAVTKKVALLVAADPDSLSGKARKARDYGIPVVTEDGFARLLAEYQAVAAHSGACRVP